MGADPESEHAIIGFANAAMVLPEGNTVIGVFALQGEINPALLETMRTMGITTPHCGPEMEKCAAQAVGHPNKVDLEKAETYMKSFQKMSKVFCLIIANEIVLNKTVFLTSLQGNSFLLKLKNKFKNKFVRVCLIRKETL